MRILIAEDELPAGMLLKKGLRELGHAVDLATDGEEALYKASINDYDLVLLDVMLPLMSGTEVCRQLRKAQVNISILMLTARDGIEERVRGLDAGADDYLTKPFQYPELLARIRALARRGPIRHLDVIEIGDLRLDLHARRASRGGEKIDLTQKEYALVEYLAQRKDQVVNRSDIAEHVWDENYDPFSNLIEVYIQRLRSKIDSGHALKLIHTKRGQGYVLSADFTEYYA
jgi:DNA-binding response OmpR family regulator